MQHLVFEGSRTTPSSEVLHQISHTVSILLSLEQLHAITPCGTKTPDSAVLSHWTCKSPGSNATKFGCSFTTIRLQFEVKCDGGDSRFICLKFIRLIHCFRCCCSIKIWFLCFRIEKSVVNYFAAVNQSLPSIDSLNTSLYFVNAGFQDYFFPLYYKNLTKSETLELVDTVVDAIVTAVKVSSMFMAACGRGSMCQCIAFTNIDHCLSDVAFWSREFSTLVQEASWSWTYHLWDAYQLFLRFILKRTRGDMTRTGV